MSEETTVSDATNGSYPPGYVPITITLNQIRAHGPCSDGWNKLLAAQGKKKADDIAFTMLDILDSNGLDDCIWAMRCLPEHNNLWRKYAVWCARQVEHLMKDERSLNALDVEWRHSDGMATDEELKCDTYSAYAAVYAARSAAIAPARSSDSATAYAADAACAALRAAYAADATCAAMREKQANKLREILSKGEL